MTVITREGTSLTAKPEIIVKVLKQADMPAETTSIQGYMEQVSQDAKRLHGVELSTESPEAFLRSLAQHRLITIEDAA